METSTHVCEELSAFLFLPTLLCVSVARSCLEIAITTRFDFMCAYSWSIPVVEMTRHLSVVWVHLSQGFNELTCSFGKHAVRFRAP